MNQFISCKAAQLSNQTVNECKTHNMRTLNKTLKIGKNINLQSYGGLVVPTCSPAHISRAIVTTHVSLGQAVPQSRFFDMNSPAVPPRPAFSTDPGVSKASEMITILTAIDVRSGRGQGPLPHEKGKHG